MKGKTWTLLAAALVLGTCYVLFYTEWLNPDPIQIQAQVRDIAPRQMFRDREANPADLRKEREARAAQARRAADEPAPGAEAAKDPAKGPAKPPLKSPAKETGPNDPNERSRDAARAAHMKAIVEERNKARLAEANAGRFDGLYPVVFALDGAYSLTQVRVVEVTPSVPGKAPKIVWQLDSTSNSVPTKALLYGRIPRGMKLKDERSKAEKLQPGIEYRLEVKAGRYKGSTTFKAKESAPPPDPATPG